MNITDLVLQGRHLETLRMRVSWPALCPSIRVTLEHYRPWVMSLQAHLENEVQKAWATDHAAERRASPVGGRHARAARPATRRWSPHALLVLLDARVQFPNVLSRIRVHLTNCQTTFSSGVDWAPTRLKVI